jgi:hypothetical protein
VRTTDLDPGSETLGHKAADSRLSGVEVHLWSVPLDEVVDCNPAVARLLTSDEIELMRHQSASREQQRRLMTHGLLRFILSLYLDVVPSAVPIEYGSEAPHLMKNDRSLHFGASTAEQEALIAIARDRHVGVDLLALIPQSQHSNAASRLHVRRAALAKARHEEAEGVAAMRYMAPMALTAHGRVNLDGWSVQDVDVPPGYAGALAAERNDWRLRQIRLFVSR